MPPGPVRAKIGPKAVRTVPQGEESPKAQRARGRQMSAEKARQLERALEGDSALGR